MFEVAKLLAHQPVPKGDGVAIVTNAGGLGVLCADACEAGGLCVVSFTDETIEALRSFLPEHAAVSNPVDMIASATAEQYRRAISVVANDQRVDALIVIHIPPQPERVDEITKGIVQGIREVDGKIPVATVLASSRLLEDVDGAGRAIPTFAFPEGAAIAMAKASAYGRWRARPRGSLPALADLRSDEAAGIVAEGLTQANGWLSPKQVQRLLACYGLCIARAQRATTHEEVEAAARSIEGPVAVKVFGPDIVHKTDVGGVRVGLETPRDAARAAGEMRARIEASGHAIKGFTVQEMVSNGVEMLVGVTHDASFGPVEAVSAGGTAAELLRDVAVRLPPITDLDAAEMVRALKTFPLLDGYRGAPKGDVAALEDAIIRVGAMVEMHPEIAEMDCNPVTVLEKGAVIVDARVHVRPADVVRLLSQRGRRRIGSAERGPPADSAASSGSEP